MATITIPSGVEQLATVNAFIRKRIPTSFLGRLHSIELAVEELLVNIFTYAYHDKDGYVEVSCQFINVDEHPHFCVVIRDWGEPFDPFNVPQPILDIGIDERKIGGLGTHIVRSVTDSYTYKRIGDTNVVELMFNFIAEKLE